MAYLKAAIVMTLGVYFKVIYRLQSFSNRLICSCKISTDKRIAQSCARSLCNSRASCLRNVLELHNPLGSVNRVPALIGWSKSGNVTSAGWQVTLCDPIWHVSSCSGEANCCKLLCSLYFTLLTLPQPVKMVLDLATRIGYKDELT